MMGIDKQKIYREAQIYIKVAEKHKANIIDLIEYSKDNAAEGDDYLRDFIYANRFDDYPLSIQFAQKICAHIDLPEENIKVDPASFAVIRDKSLEIASGDDPGFEFITKEYVEEIRYYSRFQVVVMEKATGRFFATYEDLGNESQDPCIGCNYTQVFPEEKNVTIYRTIDGKAFPEQHG
jgi:hypothetical protein